MPDIRSIVKNHALNRDRGSWEAAGVEAAQGGGAAPHPVYIVPGETPVSKYLERNRALSGLLKGRSR